MKSTIHIHNRPPYSPICKEAGRPCECNLQTVSGVPLRQGCVEGSGFQEGAKHQKGSEEPKRNSHLNNPLVWMCDKMLAFYQQFLSPLFSPCCIYSPTCSQYARIAYKRFGVARGSYLTIRRLLRCHPLHKGGFDPVPDHFSFFVTKRTLLKEQNRQAMN